MSPSPMQTPARRARPLLAALVAGAALAGTVACGAGGPAADPTTTEAMNDPALDRVRYENGVLEVAGARLTQFPDYEPSKLFKPPRDWPDTASVVLESSVDVFGQPDVAAVVFDPAEPSSHDVDRLIDAAEAMLFDGDVPTLAEATLTGSGRRCRYRVKNGAMDTEGTTSASGVIIVATGDVARVGLHIDGSDQDQIQRLTVEIAQALCPAGPEGA